MQIFPNMHVKSPEAIITRRGGVTVPRATRCTRRVAPCQRSPAAPSWARKPGPPWGPRGARRRVGYAPSASWVGRRGRLRRSCPRVAVPPLASRPPRWVPRLRRHRRSHGGARNIGGPRSTTSPSAEMESSPSTLPAGPVGLRPSRPRGARPRQPLPRRRRRRLPRRQCRARTGAVRPSQCVRRYRRACGSHTTATAESDRRRPARRASLRAPASGPKQRRPRRPAPPRTPPRPPAGGPRARRGIVHRY